MGIQARAEMGPLAVGPTAGPAGRQQRRAPGLPRLGWLAAALLRPRLGELEIDDIVQAVVRRAHDGAELTDELVRSVADEVVGLAPTKDDLCRVRAALQRAGWPVG